MPEKGWTPMNTSRAGSKTLLRELNRHLVLQVIAERAPLSRSEIARVTKLTPSTITHIVGSFVSRGLVTEEQTSNASAGRSPILVDLNPSAGALVGIKLRDEDLTLVVCDLRCQVLFSHGYDLTGHVGSPIDTLDQISEIVTGALSALSLQPPQVVGVGIGVPGIVDRSRRRILTDHVHGWHSIDAATLLEQRLKIPVVIDNVVNTLATGQSYVGTAKDVDDFLVVTIGRGIGLSAVINGSVHRGSHGAAGDFGHTIIERGEHAPECNCGKRGCLEAIASDWGIVRATAGSDPGLTVEHEIEGLVQRARNGDADLRTLFERAGAVLGAAMANLYSLFDPEVVLVSGEGLRARDLLWDPLLRAFRDGTTLPGELPLRVIETDETDWAQGASALVLNTLLSSPMEGSSGAAMLERLMSDQTRVAEFA